MKKKPHVHAPPEEHEAALLAESYEFIVPKYREAHDIMTSLLDFEDAPGLRIADLGCGFCHLSKRMLQVLPNATIFGLEKNPVILNMGVMALEDLADRFLPLESRLQESGWSEGLAPLDAVVSSFTLDYLPQERHIALIQEAFAVLNPRGRWISCEFFRAGDMRINRVFHDLEIQFIQNSIKNGHLSSNDIEQLTESFLLRQDHHICTVEEKQSWLSAAGFTLVDVPWRFLNLAVISAVKPK